MEELIVGDKDFEISKVILAMKESSVFSMLDSKWEDVALQLGTDQSMKERLQQNQLLGIGPGQSTIGILETILTDWRGRCPTEATILNLVNVLEKFDMNDIAKCLRSRFEVNSSLKEDALDSSKDNEIGDLTLIDHLDYYIVDLIENTDLNDAVLGEMVSKELLAQKEVKDLKSIRNCEERNRLFYKTVKDRTKINSEFYDHLINIFQRDSQNHRNGVSCLLNRYYD